MSGNTRDFMSDLKVYIKIFNFHMTCKIWFKDTIFVVSVLEIRLNAKFKAELDIFLKFGIFLFYLGSKK